MARYCEYCGSEIESGSFFCANCGAAVPQSGAAVQTEEESGARRRVQTPKTIDELTAFCERHELPLAKMRFFIGLDYPGAKAFGIYRDDDGNFVVYKNKADGSRAVRYRGPDEAYAVNEIFQKLKEEATNQRSRVAASRTPGYAGSEAQARNPYNRADRSGTAQRSSGKKSHKLLGIIIGLAAAITIVRAAVGVIRPHVQTPSTGYYSYGGQTYYSQNSDWYLYDNDGWYPISVADELLDNASDYYASYSYSPDYGVSDFTESDYYYYNDSYSSDYDSDSDYDYDDDWDSGSSWDWDDDDDWDSGSDWDWDSDWDSGSTDWDSDW